MPAFNLAPIEDDSAFEPVVPTTPTAGSGGGSAAAPEKKPKPTRAQMNQRLESAAGPLKPLAQFMNTLASPDVKAGIVVGPINAISKLGNAIGDAVQRKPIDTSDAWRVPDEVTRRLNPFRIGPNYGEVTPSDQPGLELGGGIGAEIVGAALGVGLLNRVGQLAQVKRTADALKATRAVRSLAVAQRANPALRTGVTAATRVGEALVGTTLAAPFINQDDGNLANLGDMAGWRLPGRAEETDNYLQKFGKGLLVEGLAAPLAAIGALSIFAPTRKAMFDGGVSFLDELGDAELAPYMYRGTDAPKLPAGADTPALPPWQDGGALVPTTPNGSAIERYLDEATQIRQVESQRQRLQGMGLVEQGEAGQLDLRVATGNPEARAQIEQLAAQRGELLAQVPNVDEATAKQLLDQIDQIDQQVADINLSGTTEEFLAPRGSRQGELDLDTRPELDTYLAQLDELDDSQLREIHSRVWRQAGEVRNAQELAATQEQIAGLNQRLADIEARQAAGELTPRGAKGQLTRVQRELAMAEQQLQAVQQRLAAPETLVGQQLEMALPQQLGLNLTPDIELPPLEMVARGPGEYGYRTPDDYRSALEAWPRDLLRRLAMPDSSPEVAALLKARTGRRVWGAKKSDIIDALVELSERRGRYLPPDPEQLAMPLTTNMVGAADAPLLDVPADLSTGSPMGRVVDADGNEVPVPMAEFQPRGMDAATREQLKAEILRRAIDNGEVQAPVTPIPNRPEAPNYFQQSNFVDDLFSDPTGQLAMAFNADALPPYKAGGKNADALLDEMRLRFEYNLLDAKAMQAQKDALMAANGWDTLSWEEKKRLGLMGRGMFAFDRYDLGSGIDRVRSATPQFNPELEVRGPRDTQPYGGAPAIEPYPVGMAAEKYTSQGIELNRELRSGNPSRESLKVVAGLQSLPNASPGTYYRGIDLSGDPDAYAYFAGLKKGDLISDPAIQSFASKKQVATEFAGGQGGNRVVIEARLSSAKNVGSQPGTIYGEAILLPDANLEVTGVTKTDGELLVKTREIRQADLQPKPARPTEPDTVMASVNGEAVVVPKEAVPATPTAKGKGKPKPTTAEAQAAKQALADIPKVRAQLAEQLEQLRKQSQGGSC